MHQHSNTEDENQIIDHVHVGDIHFGEKFAGFLEVAINFVAHQVHPVVSVYGIYQAMETRTEVWYMKHPTEQAWRIKITYAEAEDGEQHRDYRSNEDCELQRIMKFSVLLSAYI